MKTIKTNCEFASELVCVIPYAYWLHQNNQLEKVITSKGMRPFYYFCENVEERFDYRSFDMNQNGINDVPNNWLHHNSKAVFGKDYSELREEEQSKVNGVLDYSQWTPPPYKDYYNSDDFDDLKPYVVISNNFNIEAGNHISKTRRYFNLQSLSEMFFYLQEAGYNIIYKRPDNTEFTPDQNEMLTLQNGHQFFEITDQGTMSDYELCDYYDKVFNINQMEYDDYNEFQMKCFSNAEGFITPNGGGGDLCAQFGKPILFYIPSGKELRSGYMTNDNSYMKKLSDNEIHVVYDFKKQNDYAKLIEKVKEIF
jgi:hypothetical protein|tara:strand:+ start:2102 stop:3031 length:930 start_codon:yes stop_codon:yes gene_type:complete